MQLVTLTVIMLLVVPTMTQEVAHLNENIPPADTFAAMKLDLKGVCPTSFHAMESILQSKGTPPIIKGFIDGILDAAADAKQDYNDMDNEETMKTYFVLLKRICDLFGTPSLASRPPFRSILWIRSGGA